MLRRRPDPSPREEVTAPSGAVGKGEEALEGGKSQGRNGPPQLLRQPGDNGLPRKGRPGRRARTLEAAQVAWVRLS